MRLRHLFYWFRAAARRLWCRWFGCIPCVATRYFISGDEVARMTIGVTVHCSRCWRRFTDEEQKRAVYYLQETLR